MESPIKYAKSGDVHIAYRVFGVGPRDIVLIPGTISHVEAYWELPSQTSFVDRGDHELKGVPGRWRLHAVA